MQKITSKDNNLIKHIKKLKEKKYRDEFKEYVIEGIKIVQEAIQENAKIKQIVIVEEKEELKKIAEKYETILVPQNIFNQITEVKNPQGILAVIEKENEEEKIDYNEEIIVALDDLQDPGNIGTILRTVDSVGLKQILISKNTVDCYNPKVVRSTMGAIFRVKIIECENLTQTLEQAKSKKYDIMVTSLEAKKTIYEAQYMKKIIVIGNEANGVSKEIKKIANEQVIIPMLGKTESLNASIACGVILYEYVRQKIEAK